MTPFRTPVVALLAAVAAPLAAQAALAPSANPPAAAQPAPSPEVVRLTQEVADLRAKLDRQEVAADNARAELEAVKGEMKLKDELLVLGRSRNAELYRVASEILDRYGRMGIGDALVSREPYVQAGRVRLQNLVQDYEDKLRAARVTEATLPPSVEARMRADLARPAEAPASAAPKP